MAVSTTNAQSGPYLTNGVTTVFPFTFTAPSADEVDVLLVDGVGIETSASGYSVALGLESGGSVVFAVPPVAGLSLYVLLDPDFRQEIAFENGSAWRAEPVNEGYDRAAARDQVLKRDVDRGVKLPIGEDGFALPRAADRAGKALYFDNDGVPRAISPDEFGSPAAASLLSYDVNFSKPGEAPFVFNIFESVDPGRTARQLYKPGNRGGHVGELFAGVGVEFRPTGSGANGPQNADVGFVVSAIKTTDSVGEMDTVYIQAQQRGIASDVAGVLCDIARKGGTGFSAQWEGVTKDVHATTGVTLAATRIQYGMRDTVTGLSAGYYANAQSGLTKYGLLLSSDPGIFENFISCFFGNTGLAVFNVGQDGELTVRKGGLLDGADNAQLVSEFYAATGGAGTGGGNTLGVYSEFRHYTAPVDWQTSEYRVRLGVDGVSTAASSPWYALRGRSGGGSSFAVGFGYGDAPTFEIRNSGHIRSALLPSLNYANDAAAAAAGVAVGELYHTAGTVKVRVA